MRHGHQGGISKGHTEGLLHFELVTTLGPEEADGGPAVGLLNRLEPFNIFVSLLSRRVIDMRKKCHEADPLEFLAIRIKILFIQHLFNFQLNSGRSELGEHEIFKRSGVTASIVCLGISISFGVFWEELDCGIALNLESLAEAFLDGAVDFSQSDTLSLL